jgi:hypothetical protein
MHIWGIHAHLCIAAAVPGMPCSWNLEGRCKVGRGRSTRMERAREKHLRAAWSCAFGAGKWEAEPRTLFRAILVRTSEESQWREVTWYSSTCRRRQCDSPPALARILIHLQLSIWVSSYCQTPRCLGGKFSGHPPRFAVLICIVFQADE